MGIPAIIDLGLSARDRAMRKTGVGGSEVAKVIGLVPGAVDVWASKDVGVEPPPSRPVSEMEFGHRMEAIVADAWLSRHQDEHVRIYSPGTVRHRQVSYAIATPDRVVAPLGVGRPPRDSWLRDLECKVTFHDRAEDYGEAGTDEIPERHIVQVQWQLGVCGLEEATLCALVRGDYREYPITFDEELFNILLDRVGEWWHRYVVAKVPPPVDATESYRDFLRRTYPSDLEPALDPTPDLVEAAQELAEAREQLRLAEQDEALAANALKSLLGSAAGIVGLVSYKQNKPTEKTDFETMARELHTRLALLKDKDLKPWDRAIQAYTTSKPGARVLRFLRGG